MPTKILIPVLALLGLAGCSSEEDVLPAQQNQMVTFLTGSHTPRLISEEDAAESLEEDPQFYSTTGNTTYRYIRHYYDPERESRPQVTEGSRVSLTYWAYVFQYRAITRSTMPYDTNDATLRESLNATGLDLSYWSFEPLRFSVGDGSALRGVEQALLGCRLKDTVEIYMTYNMAYDDQVIGLVPYRSPVAWLVTVDELESN